MEIDSSTIITGDFNISPASMDKSSREKFNKETAEVTQVKKWQIIN